MSLFHFGGQYGNPLVSPAYFLASFVACLGTFQLIAATYKFTGLSWAPMPWQPWAGRILGGLAIVGATAWFFAGFSDGIFRPGPAGLELFVIAFGATALALVVTLAGAALLRVLPAGATADGSGSWPGEGLGEGHPDTEPGLPLLRRMTYPQALRRQRCLRRSRGG